MMYSEFVLGTGCKENEHNYEVYRNLEIMYMNGDMTKEQIYEYGMNLVDNSKTEEEIRIENEIKDEIEENKKMIESYKKDIERYKWYMEGESAEAQKHWKELIKHCNAQIKKLRAENRELKRWFNV